MNELRSSQKKNHYFTSLIRVPKLLGKHILWGKILLYIQITFILWSGITGWQTWKEDSPQTKRLSQEISLSEVDTDNYSWTMDGILYNYVLPMRIHCNNRLWVRFLRWLNILYKLRILDVLKVVQMRKGVLINRNQWSGTLSTPKHEETWGMKICSRECSISGSHKYSDVSKGKSPVMWILQ